MADTDLFVAGEQIYTGRFLTREFSQTFSELGIDRRLAVLVEIEARPQVSQLILKRNVALTPQPGNLSGVYHYYYIDENGATGIVVGGASATQFADKTDYYLNEGIPTHLIFYDENLTPRYVTTNPATPGLVASATAPTWATLETAQYVGQELEWVANDGITLYKMTVNSSNVISVTRDRIEPIRAATIRVQHGHAFAFDGVHLWIPGLIEFGTMSSSIDHHDYGYGGVSIPRLSDITLQLADRELEFLAAQSWDTRSVEVKYGITDEPIGEYEVVLRAKTERAEADQDELRIVLRDQSTLFQRSMQTHTYPGTTGAYNGTPDLTGALKPLLYGICRHFTPKLLDTVRQVYQIHDGPIHEIFSVHEGGALRNKLGDITNFGLANLNFWAPTQAQVDAGGYMTDLLRGCFKLAAAPVAPLTVVAQGHTSVPFGNPRIGDIVRTIIQEKVPEIDIDFSSIDKYLTDQPGGAGIYIDEDRQVHDVLEELAGPVGAFVWVNNLNRAGIRQLRITEPVAYIRRHSTLEGVQMEPVPTPGGIYRVGYNKAWTVLKDSDFLDNALSVAVNTFLKNEYRYQILPISGIEYTRLPVHASAKQLTIDTLLDNAGQAGAVVVRLTYLYHTLQHIYKLSIMGFTFQIEIGDTVLFEVGEVGMGENVRTGIVIAVEDKSPSDGNEDETSLTILS